ncbi:MAG: pitrilysin family protein [Candidatus Eiseniibacteriota bacterium]|jgi:predicted Zn-dependent peptidase
MKRARNRGVLVAMAGILVVAAVGPAAGATFSDTLLPGGLRLVHSENRGSGLVSIATIVRAGAAWESATTNGAAHYLEHLLFNGTVHRTQEELYRDIDLIGAYANATTRRDHVVFLMVCASEDLDRALEIHTDMLLHSTLPAGKFEKERGIILEEIAGDRSDPETSVGARIDSVFGRGTSYARPVLGTPESIGAMNREAVLDYYHRHYVPENMTVLVTGDVAADRARDAIARHMTAAPSGQAPVETPPRPALRPAVHLVQHEVDRTTLVMRFAPVAAGAEELAALELLVEVLNGDAGRLHTALGRAPELEVGEASARVDIEVDGAHGVVQAGFEPTVPHREVAARLLAAIESVAQSPPGAAELAAVRTRHLVDAALLVDQIHYVAFVRAPLVLHAPLALLGGDPELYDAVDGERLARAAARWLDPSRAAEAVVIGPLPREERLDTDPRTWARDGEPAPADVPPASGGRPVEAAGAARDASAAQAARRDTADAAWEELPHRPDAPRTRTAHAPRRLVLDNGLTVLLMSNPDSRVFAVHLAACGRSAHEPAGQAGIADLLHRMLPHGTARWSRDTLGHLLDRAGVQLKVTDQPWIPYDDYYTSPAFSYIRLETIDTYHLEALHLLAEMVSSPELADEAFEEVQRTALHLASRRAASTRDRARELLREVQWRGSPVARPPLGTSESLAGITADDVRRFHAGYFEPSNLVLAVVTGVEPPAIEEAIAATFGRLGAGAAPGPGTDSVPTSRTAPRHGPIEPPPVTTAPDRRRETLDAEQATLLVGTVFEISESDAAPLDVAIGLLSDRLAFELRERQGLAYSIGAGVTRYGGVARVVASMGTRPENVAIARDGLVEGFRTLAAAPVDDDAVRSVAKSRIGRMRMRQVSRIGQAYAMSMEELQGVPLGTDRAELAAQLEVVPDDVERVARRYLDGAPLVEVIVR